MRAVTLAAAATTVAAAAFGAVTLGSGGPAAAQDAAGSSASAAAASAAAASAAAASAAPSTRPPTGSRPAPSTRPASAAVTPVTYAYGPNPYQKLDAFLPELPERPAEATPAATPAVFVIHGGGWTSSDKRGMAVIAQAVVRDRGWAAFTLNYRLAPAARWPAQREDVLAAIAFVKANAARFRVDPRRFATLGSSAGGHLAMDAGSHGRGTDRVAATVAYSGFSDMQQAAYVDTGRGPGAVALAGRIHKAVLGCRITQCRDRWRDASPRWNASPGDAPALLFNSQRELTSPEQAVKFGAALRAVDVDAQVVLLPGHLHGAHYWLIGDVWQRTLEWLDQAFAQGRGSTTPTAAGAAIRDLVRPSP